MESLICYRTAILELLTELAAIPYAYGDQQHELVIDREQDRYLLLAVGWNGRKRVHYVVLHLDIIDGKVWIQENRTDLDIIKDLTQAGIPREAFVIGLLPPDVRSEFETAA